MLHCHIILQNQHIFIQCKNINGKQFRCISIGIYGWTLGDSRISFVFSQLMLKMLLHILTILINNYVKMDNLSRGC